MIESSEYITHQTSFSGMIVLLARFLRKKGFHISFSDEVLAIQSLGLVKLHNRSIYVTLLRACLAKTKYQFDLFFELYDEFDFELKRTFNDKVKQLPERDSSKGAKQKDTFQQLKQWLYHKNPSEQISLTTYSDIETLVKKDFSNLTDDEVAIFLRILRKIAKKMAHRKSRLKMRSKERKFLDLRWTMKENLRYGPELLHWVYSKKKNKRLKLIVLCDVSQSMDLYSKFFIQMIYAFHKSYDRIKTYAFSTQLLHLSEILDHFEFEDAFQLISDRMPQWSGGTRIGHCLDEFWTKEGIRLVDRKTIVMILSDGWDTGEPEVLSENMRRIHKAAKKVIWLNPLSGYPNFEPSAIGLSAAMPYIDELAAAHNLESLKKVIYNL